MVVSLHQSDIKQLSATALLFASWVNMGLYGVELVLCAYCLGWHCCMDNLPAGPTNTSGSPILQSNGDLRWVRKQSRLKRVGSKWFIIGALVNDTICTVALCLDTYFIVQFSNSSESMSSNNRLWPTALWILTTSLATTFEQTYFLHRYWTISKNWIITTTLAGLILCNFIFILIIDAAFIPTSNNSLVLEKLDAPFVSAIIITVVDISLAVILVWKLKSVKTTRLPTQRLIRKICIFVVGYGCITAVSSALMLVMWVVNVNGYMSIVYCLGRVYSLTVLCNFLFVSGWRNEAATADFHGELDSNLTVKASELDQIPWFKITAPSGLPTRNSSPLHQMQPPSNQTVIAQKDMLAPSFSVDTL
ncbi:hypothetical protein DFJ43DRAFT_805135 [Lentinula guzmanii]|uniref:DUF6534 domain-containing protein n=1 Tax=Lentinula guzmanii TaxID=2804957 RepID=A0AA38MW53_9AGAR|nr:hypothetical protein DFJ43DRAFT_805135 [Lentinula guzmanii]